MTLDERDEQALTQILDTWGITPGDVHVDTENENGFDLRVSFVGRLEFDELMETQGSLLGIKHGREIEFIGVQSGELLIRLTYQDVELTRSP